MNIIRGKLDPFYETGTEGVIWSLTDDINKGYDSLHILDQGDYLTIFDKNNNTSIVWEGNIDFEYERNYRQYPNNPDYGQQVVFGYYVHGFQKNIEPEQWATWFFDENPAELITTGIGQLYQCKSSTIDAYRWFGIGSVWNKDRTPADLIIKFNNGSYYRYKNVDFDTYSRFEDAESKGKFHSKHIKNKFDVERITLAIPDKDANIIPSHPLKRYVRNTESTPWPFPRSKDKL